MICGGVARRSITDSRLSATCFVGSFGSTFMAAVARARPSSGVMATLNGGPTTLPGTAISLTTRGGVRLRSMTVSVSGGALGTTFTVPLSSMTLLSFTEMGIWANAGDASTRRAVASRISLMSAPPRRAVRGTNGTISDSSGAKQSRFAARTQPTVSVPPPGRAGSLDADQHRPRHLVPAHLEDRADQALDPEPGCCHR